jgi:uncharacterized repeat protein (TIGR01451 family)
MIGGHDRTAFFGNWVVCPSCERPFAWKQARVSPNGGPTEGDTQARSEEDQRRKKMKALRKMIYSLAALTVLGGSDGLAQASDQPQALVVTAENLMADDARRQEMARRGGDPNAVFPGDVVAYQLVFTNITAAPVRNVEFIDPLPAGLQYVAQSATADRADVVIEYSADGGETFSDRPTIEVVVDGERVLRPAPSDKYTHIRWRIEGAVQPGAQVTAEFRATLPDENDETDGSGK